MSTTTTNYGLIKPDTTDPILIGQLNDNADVIDATLKSLSDAIDIAKLGIKYKGEVNYYSNLPASGNEIGDAYTVKYAGSSGTTPDGTEYVWGAVSGTNQWINFSKDSYTKAEVDALLGGKVDKETGKGLSTNDFTTAEKTKLDDLAEIKSIGTGLNLDDNGELTATGGGSGGTTNYNDLSNKPQINGNTLSGNKTSAQLGLASASDIPTVPITAIQKNGTGITPVSGTVNITVPTTATDVSALPDTTKYATALSLTINSSTYVVTGQLKDQNGDNLGTAQTIDLPLESVVVGGSYNSLTKKVVLTLQNGNTIEFSVADLVSGLQTELSASNKLNPAYINYDSTHRAVSDTEKSTWNGKQSALTTAQLAAANSGINSEKVAQYDSTTELEAEDRAALIELVDGGAKNIADMSKSIFTTTQKDGVTVTLSGDSIVSSGNSGTNTNNFFNVYFKSTTEALIPSGTWVAAIIGTGIDNFRIEVYDNTKSDMVKGEFGQALEFTIDNGVTGSYVRITNKPSTDCTGSYKLLICTKSAWDISQTYQPYRPSYQELYERVVALEQANQ